MSWRQTEYLLWRSVSNKSESVSDKSIFHKYISGESKAAAKSLIKTQYFQ